MKAPVSISRDLIGMDVQCYDSEARLGRIVDVVVHPTEGRVLALLISGDDGRRRIVDSTDFSFGDGVVFITPNMAKGGDAVREMLARGVLATKRLLGMEVITDQHDALGYVTERGRYLGSIRDIVIFPRRRAVVYRVAGAAFSGGAFFLSGNVATTYSRTEGKIEVPRDATQRFGATSPWEAVRRAKPEMQAMTR